jgi:hypothetical protein
MRNSYPCRSLTSAKDAPSSRQKSATEFGAAGCSGHPELSSSAMASEDVVHLGLAGEVLEGPP